MKVLWLMVAISATQCLNVRADALTGSICCDRCIRDKTSNTSGSIDICYHGYYCNVCPPGTFRSLKNCQCEACTVCSADSEQIRSCHDTVDALCLNKSKLSSRASVVLTSECCDKCFLDETSTSGLVLMNDFCSRSSMCIPCTRGFFRRSDDCRCYSCSRCINGVNVTQPCTETSDTVCSSVTHSFASSRRSGNVVAVFSVSAIVSFLILSR
jgi:hypothetical protein